MALILRTTVRVSIEISILIIIRSKDRLPRKWSLTLTGGVESSSSSLGFPPIIALIVPVIVCDPQEAACFLR